MEVFKYDEERVKRINQFMKKLLDTSLTEEKVKVYREFEEDISKLNPLDIFYLDFYSDDSDLSIDEIKESANKFVNVFHKGIIKYSDLGDHPLFLELLNENKRIQEHLSGIKPFYKREELQKHKLQLLKIFENCDIFEKKFIKYENIIFPNLEKYVPSTKPLEVLWELHDDARSLLKVIIDLLKKETLDIEETIKQIGAYHYLVFGINQKEEIILLPVLKLLIKDYELDRIYNECVDEGFVLNEKSLEKINLNNSVTRKGYFTSETGVLSFDQLNLLFKHLPFDLTYVDKDDFVRYYNDNPTRHFPRNPSVIGRLVKNCHPPKSVHIVEAIVEDFKNNRKDYEEFWINFKGKTLYISYYAIRDESGNYEGVLEVSQDITKFINLSGEKRLRD
jgi:DUF438 domain-containing protein